MLRRIVCLWMLVACAEIVCADEIGTDRAHDFDFSTVQTFAVKVGSSWGNSGSESAAKDGITKRLTQKGWKEGDESSSDVVVVLHGATQEKGTFPSFYNELPNYKWQDIGAPALADSDHYEYKPGTLLVDIFETKSRKAVFRGVIVGGLSGSPEQQAKRIDKDAGKLFKDLPSSKGSAGKPKESGSKS